MVYPCAGVSSILGPGNYLCISVFSRTIPFPVFVWRRPPAGGGERKPQGSSSQVAATWHRGHSVNDPPWMACWKRVEARR